MIGPQLEKNVPNMESRVNRYEEQVATLLVRIDSLGSLSMPSCVLDAKWLREPVTQLQPEAPGYRDTS